MAEKANEQAERSKEDTVSMTILVPVSVHTKMKIAAAERQTPLYRLIIETLDKHFTT